MAVLQPLSGDILAQMVAHMQPVKLAAMEAHYETRRGAPIIIGGIPDSEKAEVHYGIEIPYGLSLLSFHDPNAKVKGLKDFARENWPNVALVHYNFQAMVGCGILMMLVAAWGALLWRKKRSLPDSDMFLKALVLTSPLGFIALETGWMVTELGRQPWVVHNIIRTRDAVTPMPGLIVPFTTFTILYIFLMVIVIFLIRRQVVKSPQLKKGD
jgi:cytochrome d ubiquinol oxidase subunit I